MDTVINIDELNDVLAEQFDLPSVSNFVEVKKGLICRNFSFQSGERKFFLKLYTRNTEETIHAIKEAEIYFAEQGIPIVLPVVTRSGAYAFEFLGKWFSLFPFVDTPTPEASELTDVTMVSMGKMLAALHLAGKQAQLESFATFRFWDRDAFFADAEKIQAIEATHAPENTSEELAFANIRSQREYLEQTSQRQPEDFGLPFDHLLHGDFIYTNTFVDTSGEVLMTYDLEKAGVGPRAYELARSMFISCFDDGWNEKNFEFARLFLSAYQTVYPISREEFVKGVHMYVTHFMHMSWLESKIILEKSVPHYRLIEPAFKRMGHFRGDLDWLVDQLFVT